MERSNRVLLAAEGPLRDAQITTAYAFRFGLALPAASQIFPIGEAIAAVCTMQSSTIFNAHWAAPTLGRRQCRQATTTLVQQRGYASHRVKLHCSVSTLLGHCNTDCSVETPRCLCKRCYSPQPPTRPPHRVPRDICAARCAQSPTQTLAQTGRPPSDSISKSFVSRREAADSAVARQGEATTTRMI